MTERTHSLRRRLTAVAGAAAVALTGLLAIPGAIAAPNPDGSQNIQFNPDKTTSLTIFKSPEVGNTTQYHPDGDKEAPALNGIADVEFTVYPIGDPTKTDFELLDLSVYSNWDYLTKLRSSNLTISNKTITDGTNTYPLDPTEPPITMTTGPDGKVTRELPIGAYLVVETKWPDAVTTPAEPFIVTIPFPDNGEFNPEPPDPSSGAPKDSFEWIYNVRVYPKNTLGTESQKDVKQENEKATWTITQPIPPIKPEVTFTGAAISDTLGDRNLRYVPGSMHVKILDAGGNELTDFTDKDGWTFDEPTDATINAADTSNKVSVTALDTTLAALKANPGGKIVMWFETTVLDTTKQDPGSYQPGHMIKNVANPTFELSEGEITIPPPDKDSYWGWIDVDKVDEGGTPLADAYFEVRNTKLDTDGTTVICGDTIIYGKDKSLKTGANGKFPKPQSLSIPEPDLTIDYCLREVEPPAGYKRPALPDKIFTLKYVDNTPALAFITLEVENEQFGDGDLPRLPLTGANGQMILLLGGAAVVAIGVGFGLRGRSKRQG